MIREDEPSGISGEISWDKFEEDIDSFERKIRESGFDPDIIIGIERGGLIPTALLAYRLRKPSASLAVIKDGESRRVVRNPLIDWKALPGIKVLLVEDRLETGRSAQAGIDELTRSGAEVKLACISASSRTEIEPAFVLERTDREDKFPWEPRA